MKNKRSKPVGEQSHVSTGNGGEVEQKQSVGTGAIQRRAKREPLTAEKLRTFQGCEHYTDEEADEIVASIRVLATILLQAVLRDGTHYDNQDNSLTTKIAHDTNDEKLAA